MLNKILLVVSLLVLAVGAYLGYTNRSEFKATRLEKNRLNHQEIEPTKKKIDSTIDEIEKELAIWRDATASKDEKLVALDGAKKNFTAKTADLDKLQKDIVDKNAEIAKMEADLKAILPPGYDNPEQINQTIDKLNGEVQGLKTDADAKTAELTVWTGKVNENKATLGELQKHDGERNKGISLNGLEGTLIAVNQDYGFAVVNIGENQGVTGDSKLIVMRGQQRVGLLSITSIEKTRTIADIVQKSLAAGMSVAPGDRVIFEKVQH